MYPPRKKPPYFRSKKPSRTRHSKNFLRPTPRQPVFHQGGLGWFDVWFGGGPGGNGLGGGRSQKKRGEERSRVGLHNTHLEFFGHLVKPRPPA